MAEEKLKSYIADMQLEIVSDDNKTVKAIRIHGFHHEQMPVYLWCDLMRRFGQMTPDEEVMFVQSGKRIDEYQYELLKKDHPEIQKRID